jgi:hypothetical protein
LDDGLGKILRYEADAVVDPKKVKPKNKKKPTTGGFEPPPPKRLDF